MKLFRLFLWSVCCVAHSVAYAELVGYHESDIGVIYFLDNTRSGCEKDQQAVLVQSVKYPNGAPRVLKTSGCWLDNGAGILVVNWPESGSTQYKRSDLQKTQQNK